MFPASNVANAPAGRVPTPKPAGATLLPFRSCRETVPLCEQTTASHGFWYSAMATGHYGKGTVLALRCCMYKIFFLSSTVGRWIALPQLWKTLARHYEKVSHDLEKTTTMNQVLTRL